MSRNRSSSHWMKLSSIEAVLSDEGNEAGLAQGNPLEAGVAPLDEGENLSASGAHRNQESASGRELLDERWGDLGAPRGYEDGIIGRVGAPPQGPVAVQHGHVRHARRPQRFDQSSAVPGVAVARPPRRRPPAAQSPGNHLRTTSIRS